MTRSEPVQVWMLSDGRAGHFNQTRAIAIALGRHLAMETTILPCSLRAGLWQWPLRLLLNARAGRLPSLLLRLTHRLDPLPASRPGLIVSAGGHTRFANVVLARQTNCPNLFCGRTRGLRDGLFAGIITAYPGHDGDPRYIFSPTPVPIEPAELAQAGAALRARLQPANARLWSLLVGGDGAGYRYSEADWRALAAALKALAQRHAIRWLIATSRRSGPLPETVLAAELDASVVAAATFINTGARKEAAYQEILGAAERHVCTEDSHMMISEAIATGSPVHTVRPVKFRTDPTNLHFLELYERERRITRHDIATFATTVSAAFTTPIRNSAPPADALGQQLHQWWQRTVAR